MSSNFLDIETNNNLSNIWRNIFFIFIIFFGGGIGVVAYNNYAPSDEVASKEAHITLAVEESVQQEGDVIVEPPAPPIPELVNELPDPSSFSARAIIVKDYETGVVLFGKSQYEERASASITKLMSSLIFLKENPDWKEKVKVVTDDVMDTHMYAGDTFTLEDLWRSALIGSSNKAILTLARSSGLAKPEFVQKMNEKALELGMTQTVFEEPTGLSPNNVSTASDIAILLYEALGEKKIRDTLKRREHTLYSNERKKRHGMWNTNWMLLGWIPNNLNMHGGKTGYIDASGYNFTTRVSNEDGIILDIVILGANQHEARFTEARDIALAVYNSYKWPE